MIFARKMPKFYVIIARKIFFPNFFFWGGGTCRPPAPRLLCLWSLSGVQGQNPGGGLGVKAPKPDMHNLQLTNAFAFSK